VSGTDHPHAGDELDPSLSPEEGKRWLEAVRAAWAPAALDPDRHDRILREALEDPFAEPSAEELREAEGLRQALEEGGEHEHAALVRALTHALGGARLEPEAAERALDKALATPPASPRARSNLILVTFGVAASSLALAASVALVVGSAKRPESTVALRDFAPSRSLAPLLDADASQLTASERMDRVASVRARELRENRYAKWGVR
jgi:hypothetical protein